MAVARHVAEHSLQTPGGVARLLGNDEEGATRFEIMVREMLACLEQRQLRSENCAYVWAKQRIDALRREPGSQSFTMLRIGVLEHLLNTLED